jgi:hypothetical protein
MDTRPDRERRRRRGAGWLWLLLLLLLALAIALLVAFTGGSGDDSKSSAGGVKGANTSLGGSGSSGTLTAGQTNLLGVGTGALAKLVGKQVTAKSAPVVSVVGDEVFWVGSGMKRVLVHLTHTNGESAPTVKTGDHVTFTGTVAANGRHDTSTWGITKKEDEALYNREKVHVETKLSTLKVQS